jgi:hypothetical protein
MPQLGVRNSFEEMKIGEEVGMIQIESEVVTVGPTLDSEVH